MSQPLKKSQKQHIKARESSKAVPGLPPNPEKQASKACFSKVKTKKGHKRDTLLSRALSMPKFSEPALDTSNPKKWFIYYNYDIPDELRHKYPGRKRKRFKEYDNINRLKGDDRLSYAQKRVKVWKYILSDLHYNPFEEELEQLHLIQKEREDVSEQINIIEEISEEDRRKLTPVGEAFGLFVESRKRNIKNVNSISTYKGTIKWLTEYFENKGLLKIEINKVSRLMISDAIMQAKEARKWSQTTFNKEVDFCMTVFNWFAAEEYMDKNPAAGKIKKLQTLKRKHQWYDRETAGRIKHELLNRNLIEVYRACQFTYYLCVRSQQELMKLQVSDIDWTLKRFRFRAEVSKNKREEYREIHPVLMEVLKEMELHKLPGSWYIFGRFGKPGPVMIGKNYLAAKFKPVRDDLQLSEYFDIYGWKHTRVVHEMMRGSDPYEIQYLCRHSDLKETQNYMRDFDISLRNVYSEEDLKF